MKNKMAPPFRQAEFDIIYGQGISREGDVLDLAVEHGLIAKSGAWYSYGDERLGQGRDKVAIYLQENPKLLADLEQMVRAKSGLLDSEPANDGANLKVAEPVGGAAKAS